MTFFENLAKRGIKQRTKPDIKTIAENHYDLLVQYAFTRLSLGFGCDWLKTLDAERADIVSGYRDFQADSLVSNSPHMFATALDVIVSFLSGADNKNRGIIVEAQIKMCDAALKHGFKRAGLYPEQNTCHIDICGIEWQQKYGGSPYWVKWKSDYYVFNSWEKTCERARELARA